MGSPSQEVSKFTSFPLAFFTVADIIYGFFFLAFSKRFVPRVIHSFMTDLNPEDVPSLLHLLHYTLSCKLDCLKRFDQESY